MLGIQQGNAARRELQNAKRSKSGVLESLPVFDIKIARDLGKGGNYSMSE